VEKLKGNTCHLRYLSMICDEFNFCYNLRVGSQNIRTRSVHIAD